MIRIFNSFHLIVQRFLKLKLHKTECWRHHNRRNICDILIINFWAAIYLRILHLMWQCTTMALCANSCPIMTSGVQSWMPVHLNSWGLEFVWWCAGTEIVFKQNAQYIYFNWAHLWKIGKLVMCTMCTSHIWDAVILWKTTNMRCSRLRALWVVTNHNITMRLWQCLKLDSFSTWVGEQRWKDPLKNGMQKIIGFGTWDIFLYICW